MCNGDIEGAFERAHEDCAAGRLSFGQTASQRPANFFALLVSKIPFKRAPQTVGEFHLRLPAQKSFCQRIIRHPIERSDRHVGAEGEF
jgi:hypothetical protein